RRRERDRRRRDHRGRGPAARARRRHRVRARGRGARPAPLAAQRLLRGRPTARHPPQGLGHRAGREGEFRQPYFLDPQQTFIAPLTQLRDEEPGFTVARIRFAPRVERKLLPQLRLALGYNVEYDDLSHVADSTIERFEGGRDAY